MAAGGERKVQDNLLELAEDLGWSRVSQEQMNTLREGSMSDAVVPVLLEQAIRKLNPGIEDARVESTIQRVRSTSDSQEFLRWLRHGLNVPLAGAKSMDVRIIDLVNPSVNDYVVTEEMVIATGGAREPRLDTAFLVNGLPLGIVENKAPTMNVAKAAQDFARYWDDAPQLEVVGVIAGICNGVRFRVGPTGRTGLSGYAEWKDTYPRPLPEGAGEMGVVATGVFAPHTLADLAANFVVHETRDGKTRKKLARYQQFRGASKIVARVAEGEYDRGLIWHTQGSGKTLTMVFAARKLLAAGLESPTVLIVVDRVNLDSQTNDTLTACKFDEVSSADTTAQLQAALANDQRGVIVTTINKFRGAEADLINRENVIVMVDEAHRTQEGDLGIYMRAALPNAKLFGFTGTPIESTDHSTRKGFSPEINGTYEDYLDAYRIKEAIDDGATVPIVYEARIPQWEVHLSDLDDSFEKETASLTDEQRTELLSRTTRLAVVAKAPDRIAAVAADVAQYLQEHTAPNGFKAQFVATDREACALMAEELSKHLLPDEFAVVMSRGKNDTDLQRRWHASAQLARLGVPLPAEDSDEDPVVDDIVGETEAAATGLTMEEKKAVKELVRRFSSPSDPLKLLIVNNMLLTGFDAPVEQVMFLDRGLSGHNLLQAIARTNRPMPEQGKEYGVVIDYWGVFAQLEKALATFNTDDVKYAAIKVDQLRERFPVAIAEALALVAGYPETGSEDQQGAWLLMKMQDEDMARLFEERWRAARKIYETVAPDPGLQEHLPAYRRLAEIHTRLRVARHDPVFDPSEHLVKTAAIIHEAVDVEKLNKEHAAVLIDGTLLDKLAGNKDLKPEEKAALIDGAVVHEIAAAPHDPVMQTLSERLEQLRTQKAATDAEIQILLAEYEQLVLTITEHQTAPGKLDLSEEAYALMQLVLKRAPSADEETLLAAVKRIDARLPEIAGFVGWETRSDVRQAVGKMIIQELAKDEDTLGLIVGGFADDAVQLLVEYAGASQ